MMGHAVLETQSPAELCDVPWRKVELLLPLRRRSFSYPSTSESIYSSYTTANVQDVQ